MNLSVTPVGYSQNFKNNAVKQNNPQVAFQGARGDKIVYDILRGVDVQPKDIMKEVKGTFGIKTDSLMDVLESFVDKIRALNGEKGSLAAKLTDAQNEIAKFPDKQMNLQMETERQMREGFQSVLAAKDKEVAAAKAEAKEAKEFAAKYEPAVKIKSVDEIDTIMPEEALKVFDEMIEHKVAARKSMFDYLFTGKGQEEALAQLDRSAMMGKAMRDGFFNIDDFSSAIDTKARANGLYFWGRGTDSVLALIKSALTGDLKGEYIASPVVRETVKNNAMALLTPFIDKKAPRAEEALLSLEAKLKSKLDESLAFHSILKQRIATIKANNKELTVKIERVPFDNKASKVSFYNADNACVMERTFRDLV